MTTCTAITLGGITFDCGTPDGNGIVWSWTRLDGWEPPDLRIDRLVPAGMDGEIPGEWHHQGRAMVLAGIATAESPSYPDDVDYWTAFNTLSVASNLVSGSGTLVVNEPTPKQATVKREGRARMRPYRDRVIALEFEIPLLATDWRKYGTTLNADSSSPVSNAGNVRSSPSIVVTGASTNPRVTNTTDDSKYVEVTTTLGGGETLTIDMLNKIATHSTLGVVDGLIVAGSRWWDLLPGNNVVSLTGGGSFSVQYRDAYI